MKRITIFAAMLLCVMAPRIHAADANHGDERCSNADLKGVYSFVASGTLVWREGMAQWQSYSSVRTGDDVPGVVGRCSQCEDAQLHSEMVRFGADWVCAKCKDHYTQRLREDKFPCLPSSALSSCSAA